MKRVIYIILFLAPFWCNAQVVQEVVQSVTFEVVSSVTGTLIVADLGYTDEQITALIASGYIPVANAEDLKCIDTTYVIARTFAAGTQWETSTTTSGPDDTYLQVSDIELHNDTLEALYGSTWYDNTTGWEGIGERTTSPFTGIFDGGNLRITNLFMDDGGNDTFIGLFDALENGVIRNVRMDDVDISGTSVAVVYCGALVGILEGDTVENIRVTGTVDMLGDRVGGIVGDQRTNQVIVDRISFVGDVTGGDDVGGIMGFSNAYTMILTNSYAQGSVTGDDAIGGLFGQVRYQNRSAGYDYVSHCYAANTITATTNPGGLAGDFEGTQIIDSYYDTTVTGEYYDDKIGVNDPRPRTTTMMQGATAPNQTIGDSIMYAGWPGYVWDFGTASEYPTFNDLPISGNAPDDFMAAWDQTDSLYSNIFGGSTHEHYPVAAMLYEGVADTAIYLAAKAGNTTLRATYSDDGVNDWTYADGGSVGVLLHTNNWPSELGTVGKYEYSTWRLIDGTYYLIFGVNLNTGSYGVGYATSDTIDEDYDIGIQGWLINPDTNSLGTALGIDSINFITAPELIRIDNTYHWFGSGQYGDEFYTYFVWHGTSPVSDLTNITFDNQVIYDGADTHWILEDELAEKGRQILQTPRIYYDDGYYYMALTVGGIESEPEQRFIYVARSTSITGFNLANLQRTPIITTDGADTWNEWRVYCFDILKKNDGYWVEPHTINDSIRMYFCGHSLEGSSYTPQNTGIPGLARILDE